MHQSIDIYGANITPYLESCVEKSNNCSLESRIPTSASIYM